ncbi:hypothetical protein [Actinomadura sp. 21ATH]|uniref:hypothetical protein n=1 Tax=Actinomadura sp. 21ATH TaxID=1735444 RepID=UPI0035BF0C91
MRTTLLRIHRLYGARSHLIDEGRLFFPIGCLVVCAVMLLFLKVPRDRPGLAVTQPGK